MIIYSGAERIVWAVERGGPDGGQIAALTDAGVHVWNVGEHSHPHFLPASNEGRVHSDLRISPDGEWMASFGAGKIWIWRSGRNGWQLHAAEAAPGLLAARFTAPGILDCLGARDRSAGTVGLVRHQRRLARHPTQEEIVCEFAAPEGVDSAAEVDRYHYFTANLSADGDRFLFSPSSRHQFVWNTRSGHLLGTATMRSICNEAVFSPDGSQFAVDGGTSVYVYRVEGLQLLNAWKVKHCYAPKLAWSPDGARLLRADASTTVRQFDPTTGHELQALGQRNHRATAVRYGSDGLTFLMGTFRGNVVAWDME